MLRIHLVPQTWHHKHLLKCIEIILIVNFYKFDIGKCKEKLDYQQLHMNEEETVTLWLLYDMTYCKVQTKASRTAKDLGVFHITPLLVNGFKRPLIL